MAQLAVHFFCYRLPGRPKYLKQQPMYLLIWGKTAIVLGALEVRVQWEIRFSLLKS